MKIWKDIDGKFYPTVSYLFKTQDSPPGSYHNPTFEYRSSVEDALKEAFTAGLQFYRPDDEEINWAENELFI